MLPTPLHTRPQPCPAGAGCCLSPESDGAVTLGSPGPSPQLSDPVRHPPLPSPGTGSAVPQPSLGSCVCHGKEGHSQQLALEFWHGAHMSGMGHGDTVAQRKLVLLSAAQGCCVWFQGRRAPSARTLSPPRGTGRRAQGSCELAHHLPGEHSSCQATVYPSLPLTSH